MLMFLQLNIWYSLFTVRATCEVLHKYLTYVVAILSDIITLFPGNIVGEGKILKSATPMTLGG